MFEKYMFKELIYYIRESGRERSREREGKEKRERERERESDRF